MFQRGDHVEGVRTIAAAAVRHSRGHEQAIGALNLADTAERLQHALMILHAISWRDLWIAPAVILDQLPPAVDERLDVRIERVDRVVVRFLCTHDVGFKVECVHIPAGVLEHEEPELIESGRSSRRGPSHVRPSELAARQEAGDFAFRPGIHLRRVQHPCRMYLCRRQARRLLGILAAEHFWIERAPLRIVDYAILHAIQ